MERRKAAMSAWMERFSHPPGMDENLVESYCASRYIDTVFDEFIRAQVRERSNWWYSEDRKTAAREIVDAYVVRMLDKLGDELKSIEARTARENGAIPGNLYELAGAPRLALANNVTRSVSTGLGNIWEQIAQLSPYCLSPEKDFGQKIAGVDIVLVRDLSELDSDDQLMPCFTQIKTQKNTLTGSQVPRSLRELRMHTSSMIAACFDTDRTWSINTTQHPNIERVCGADYWVRLGWEYGEIEQLLRRVMHPIEDFFTQ